MRLKKKPFITNFGESIEKIEQIKAIDTVVDSSISTDQVTNKIITKEESVESLTSFGPNNKQCYDFENIINSTVEKNQVVSESVITNVADFVGINIDQKRILLECTKAQGNDLIDIIVMKMIEVPPFENSYLVYGLDSKFNTYFAQFERTELIEMLLNGLYNEFIGDLNGPAKQEISPAMWLYLLNHHIHLHKLDLKGIDNITEKEVNEDILDWYIPVKIPTKQSNNKTHPENNCEDTKVSDDLRYEQILSAYSQCPPTKPRQEKPSEIHPKILAAMRSPSSSNYDNHEVAVHYKTEINKDKERVNSRKSKVIKDINKNMSHKDLGNSSTLKSFQKSKPVDKLENRGSSTSLKEKSLTIMSKRRQKLQEENIACH